MFKKKALALIFAALTAAAFSPEKLPPPFSKIDWEKGVLRAGAAAVFQTDETGAPLDMDGIRRVSLAEARLELSRSLRARAVESIVSLLRTINVDPDTRLADLIENEVTARRRLARILESKISFKEGPAGFFGARCEAELKLRDLMEALPYEYPESEIPSADDNPIPTVYSSLIIDARGMAIVPMIFPSVYNEQGLEIYGKDFLAIKEAARRGAAVYVTDENSALGHASAGSKPLFTAAVSAVKGSPVISNVDFRKAVSSRETMMNIKNCRVIIIVSRERIR